MAKKFISSSILVRVTRPAMGSLFEIYLGGDDEEALIAIGEAGLDRVDGLEKQLSHYRPDSAISLLNARAYANPVPIAPDQFRLLTRLSQLSEATEGAFDVTAGKLVRLWGFFRQGIVQGETVAPPDPRRLAEIVQQIGWRNVELNQDAGTVRFLTPEVELHLGAFGKGYIVQDAADYLRQQGVERAMLHCGQSSIVAIGAPPESEGWALGLAAPDDSEATIGQAILRDASLTTSGSAEHFVSVDSRRLSHLFDPRTGHPVESLFSVTVRAPDAADGDALSTAFAIQGPEWTRRYCATHPQIAALFLQPAAASESGWTHDFAGDPAGFTLYETSAN